MIGKKDVISYFGCIGMLLFFKLNNYGILKNWIFILFPKSQANGKLWNSGWRIDLLRYLAEVLVVSYLFSPIFPIFDTVKAIFFVSLFPNLPISLQLMVVEFINLLITLQLFEVSVKWLQLHWVAKYIVWHAKAMIKFYLTG